jgi:hypothetical protein
LLELGLHLGLKLLSAEELADCFDEVCPCGKTHNADALKKQRARVLKDLETTLSQSPDMLRGGLPGNDLRFAGPKDLSPKDTVRAMEASMSRYLE